MYAAERQKPPVPWKPSDADDQEKAEVRAKKEEAEKAAQKGVSEE